MKIGKKLLFAFNWTVILFILLAIHEYCRGNENWIIKALDWAIPAGCGLFCGLLLSDSMDE